jgi:hypothetical protein
MVPQRTSAGRSKSSERWGSYLLRLGKKEHMVKLRGGWTIGFPVSFSRAEVPPDVRTQKDVKAGVGEARKEG